MAQSEADGAADAADDQLKKRARRRLVGAIALVLAAVIALPMVMDREPRPAAPDIQVRIPSQDDMSPSSRAPARPIKPAPASSAGVVETPPEAPKKPEPEPLQTDKAKEPPKETGAEKSKPALTDKAQESKPAAEVAAATAKTSEAERAKAALSGAAPAPAHGNGQWVVQLGAYRETGNVKLLLAKIKEMGLPVYTEKFDTPQGPRTRVRAGPFSSREAAQKAQTRIKTIGVDGPVAEK